MTFRFSDHAFKTMAAASLLSAAALLVPPLAQAQTMNSTPNSSQAAPQQSAPPASPAAAQNSGMQNSSGTAAPSSSMSAPSSAQGSSMPSSNKQAAPLRHAARHAAPSQVEARIKQLHTRLHITSAEESQWKAVADAMRSNAQQVRDLIAKRNQSDQKSTAVDNLKSYEAIADAHADGLKKLVPAFDTLYKSMSESQKKVADAVFRNPRGGRTTHKAS